MHSIYFFYNILYDLNKMQNLNTRVISMTGSSTTTVSATVASSGTRVCMRAFGLMEYGTSGTGALRQGSGDTSHYPFVTWAIFKNGAGTEVFKLITANYRSSGLQGAATPMTFIEIPGSGILFDGLIITLDEYVTRLSLSRTLMQVFYT